MEAGNSRKMARKLALILVLMLAYGPLPAVGQQVQRIAAIVNDDVISLYDLNARIRLVIVSSQLPDDPKIRRRIAPQVLRTLIDERLQTQEAKRRNVSVTSREMKAAIGNIERQNQVPNGGFIRFLEKNRIESGTVQDQLRAGIAWSKLVRRRLRPRITVGDDEIDEEIARIKSNRGKTEYRVGEIFLSVDSPDEEAQVRTNATRLVSQIRKGARFSGLARQFSQSATAAVNGDLGWTVAGELGDDLRDMVPKMKRGKVVGPIRTVTGFRIIRLVDKRKIAGADASQIKVGLKQFFLPVPKGAPADEVKSQIDLAKTVRETISGCTDIVTISKEVGSPRPADLGKHKLTDLSPTVREAVGELKVGEVSALVRTDDGVMLLMVCDRVEPLVALPGRDQISNNLTRRRLGLMARRYLRDIRRSAIVDVRV